MTSPTHRYSFADLRIVCDYLRGVSNEIAVDIRAIEMAGLNAARYGKLPRPSLWIGQGKHLAFISRLAQYIALPIWYFLAPMLFRRQCRKALSGYIHATVQPFDESGQVLAFSIRTLDIVHSRNINFAPRQWLELPWLPLKTLPEGFGKLRALDLLSAEDLERSITLAVLAHRALQRRRFMLGWGLQSYTAWRAIATRLVIDKLPGPLLTVEHFDRWAVMVDGSVRRSSANQPARKLILMQHGSVNADVTPRGLGFRLPARLRGVGHLHAYSQLDVEVFKEEILSANLSLRGFDISFYRPNIELTRIGGTETPSILFVGYPICEAAHRALAKALNEAGTWQLFYKPHPTSRANAGIAKQAWSVVEGRSMFPRVDLLISYPSTLVSEYAEQGVPAVIHSMDVTPDQILARMPEILQVLEARQTQIATPPPSGGNRNPIQSQTQ